MPSFLSGALGEVPLSLERLRQAEVLSSFDLVSLIFHPWLSPPLSALSRKRIISTSISTSQSSPVISANNLCIFKDSFILERK